MLTMAYDTDDEEYPKDWIVTDDGPRCTAFVPDGEEIKYRCDKTKDMFES